MLTIGCLLCYRIQYQQSKQPMPTLSTFATLPAVFAFAVVDDRHCSRNMTTALVTTITLRAGTALYVEFSPSEIV